MGAEFSCGLVPREGHEPPPDAPADPPERAPTRLTIFEKSGVACLDVPTHEFLCAVKRGRVLYQGTLYLSEKHAAFYSNVLGISLSLLVPLRSITDLATSTLHVVNPCIVVRLELGGHETLASFFGKGWPAAVRDQAYGVLHKYWRLQRPPVAAPSKPCCLLLPCCATPTAQDVRARHAESAAAAVQVGRAPLSDPTHAGPYAHPMISLELACGAKQAYQLLFGDEAFEMEAKAYLGGDEIRVGPWMSEGAAPARAVREAHWRQFVGLNKEPSALGKELMARLSVPSHSRASLRSRSGEPQPGAFAVCNEVRVPDVPYGEAFVLHSKWLLLPLPPGERGARCSLDCTYEVQFVRPILFLQGIFEAINLQEARKTYKKTLPLLARHFPDSRVVSSP